MGWVGAECLFFICGNRLELELKKERNRHPLLSIQFYGSLMVASYALLLFRVHNDFH